MGSSAYALSVGTLFFPLYFRQFAAGGQTGASTWAVAVLLSTVFVGLLAPIVGTYADQRAKRNRLFMVAGVSSVIGTAALPLTAFLSVNLAVVLFVVVHVAFNLATNLYDSYISLYGAADGNYVRRSGLGWALGYAGGLLCLGATLASLGFRVPSTQDDYWLVFLICAAVYGTFSAIVLVNLPSETSTGASRSGAISGALATLRRWRERPLFFKLVVANILIVDGMTTGLYFMSTYASDVLKFSMSEIVLIFAIVQGVAIPSTWLVSEAVRYVREVHLTVLTCLGWAILMLLFTARPTYSGMLWISVGAGLVVGATPALLRAMVGRLVRADERAELFGFAALASRMGAILGPLIYLSTLNTIGRTAAMLSAVPAFVIGAVFLLILAKKLPTDHLAKSGQPEVK